MEEIRLPAAWQDWHVSEDGLLGAGSYGQVYRIERQVRAFTEYSTARSR